MNVLMYNRELCGERGISLHREMSAVSSSEGVAEAAENKRRRVCTNGRVASALRMIMYSFHKNTVNYFDGKVRKTTLVFRIWESISTLKKKITKDCFEEQERILQKCLDL